MSTKSSIPHPIKISFCKTHLSEHICDCPQTVTNLVFSEIIKLKKSNLQTIEYLDISHNQLKSKDLATIIRKPLLVRSGLTMSSFFFMKNLQVLNLSHNQIIVIPKNTFLNQINLKELDLSHNQISKSYQFGD